MAAASDAGTIIGVIILCVIGACAFVGNLLVFFSVYRDKKLRTKGGVFICCLASADFLVSIYNIPLTIVSSFYTTWRVNRACEIMAFFEMLLLVVSVQSLTAISLNRYFFIIHWHRYHEYFRRRNTVLYIIAMWIISGLLCMPPLIGWSKFGYKVNKGHCFVLWKADPYYTYFMAFTCFCCPIISMSICYYRIVRYTRKTRRDVQMMSSPSAGRSTKIWRSESSSSTVNMNSCKLPDKWELPHIGQEGRFKKYVPSSYAGLSSSDGSCASYSGTETLAVECELEEKNPAPRNHDKRKKGRLADEQRLTRMFIVVVIVFFASWFPFVITMFTEFYTTVKIPSFLDKVALLLGYANSMYNPIIYGFMNGRYRRVYRIILSDLKNALSCARKQTN